MLTSTKKMNGNGSKKGRVETMVHFLNLPMDCLFVITSCFQDSRTAINLMTSCKFMLSVLSSERFYGFENAVFSLNKMKKIDIPDDKFFVYVRKIKLNDCFCHVSKITPFFKYFPRMKILDVSHMEYITDQCLFDLPISELNVVGCQKIRGDCFLPPSKMTETLDTLHLGGNSLVTRKLGNSKFIFIGKRLKRLFVIHDTFRKSYRTNIQGKILQNFNRLEELHLLANVDLGFETSIGHLKRLKRLIFPNGSSFNFCNLRELTNLEVLVLNGIDNHADVKDEREENSEEMEAEGVSLKGMCTIDDFRNLSNLRRLEIGSSFMDFDPVILTMLPSLQILNVRNADKKIVRAALELKNLRKIKVCQCDYNSVEGLKKNGLSSKDGFFEFDDCLCSGHYYCDNCRVSSHDICKNELVACKTNTCYSCKSLVDNESSCICSNCEVVFCILCRKKNPFVHCKTDFVDHAFCKECVKSSCFSIKCAFCSASSCKMCCVECRKCRKFLCKNCIFHDTCHRCGDPLSPDEDVCILCSEVPKCSSCIKSGVSNPLLCKNCAGRCVDCNEVKCSYECMQNCFVCQISKCYSCFKNQLFSCYECKNYVCVKCGVETLECENNCRNIDVTANTNNFYSICKECKGSQKIRRSHVIKFRTRVCKNCPSLLCKCLKRDFCSKCIRRRNNLWE